MKVYGVFCKGKLIYSDVMTYAIYEKRNFADGKKNEMKGYYPNETYNVREIELDVDVAHGTKAMDEVTEK